MVVKYYVKTLNDIDVYIYEYMLPQAIFNETINIYDDSSLCMTHLYVLLTAYDS